MSNKKFFYGVGVGILGSVLYPKYKNVLRTAAVMALQEALIAYDAAKEFINDVDGKTKINEIEDSGNIKNEIQELQQKLEELQAKLKSSI